MSASGANSTSQTTKTNNQRSGSHRESNNTLCLSNSSAVSVGNDVDSMYGIRAYLRSTGEYVVTKDDYNSSNILVYRWIPSS